MAALFSTLKALTTSEFIGFIASLITTFSFAPQAFKVYKDKSSQNISTLSFSAILLGGILWIVYGLMIHSLPIVFTNVMICFFSSLILLSKMIFKV